MTKLETLLENRARFLSFLLPRVGNLAQAEDILQTAYVRALQHQDDVQEHESVVGWFYRVLRNAVIDHYRRGATENEALMAWEREMVGASAPPPELRDAVCACIEGALDSLPENYAQVLRQVDLAEESLSAYAKKHGLTENNAAVRAHRARAALRKQLLRCCGVCAEHHCENCTCRHD